MGGRGRHGTSSEEKQVQKGAWACVLQYTIENSTSGPQGSKKKKEMVVDSFVHSRPFISISVRSIVR